MKQINEEADADEQTVRISIDAKATVKVGPFARGGKSRLSTKAADHDFEPEATVTPVGIFLPAFDEIFSYGVISKVTTYRSLIFTGVLENPHTVSYRWWV